MVQVTLAPGEFVDIDKLVEVPVVPPKLDICLVVDLSGSYSDDLGNIKSLAPGLFDAVKAQVNDVRFGLASFVDCPFLPWGSSGAGDYAYRLDQDLTPDKATWLAAVNAMGIRNGSDWPESQYEALYQVAMGTGRDFLPIGPSPGDVAAGQQCNYRPDATKLVILTTDASFHNPGDGGGTFPYMGPTRDETVTALQGAGIKVIGLKAPGAQNELDDLAAATGGAVKPTSSTSSDIADAILAALEELVFDIAGYPVGCDPLLISYDPPMYLDVPGGEVLLFDEHIEVPADVTGDLLDENGNATYFCRAVTAPGADTWRS